MKKMNITVLFCYALSILIFFANPLLSQTMKCHPEDKQALLKIKQAFNNPEYMASWNPNTNCCYDWDDFAGPVVQCDPHTSRVSHLSFIDGNISGPIPDAIGELTYLEYLDLRYLPYLSGTIPNSISALTRLTYLSISSTNISGPIPSFISQLRNLTLLNLGANHLTGTILPSLSQLRNLEDLRLYGNRLTGPIPNTFSNISPHLQYLYLSNNQLSGPIPSFLSQLQNLSILDLSSNILTGSIPPSLSQLRNLQLLDLQGNKLTGPIPVTFDNITPSLQNIYFSNNQLSGTVPRGWGDSQLVVIYLQNNRLEGDISFLFGKNKTVADLDLSRNKLQFDLSEVEFPAGLLGLDLSHNRIYGKLPEDLITLENLVNLNVSYNRLCGQVPVGGKLDQFDYTAYFHNRCLCGVPLPNCTRSL